MELAKDRLDLGLVCDDTAVSTALARHVPHEEVLPIQPGWEQHRHTLAGSVLKVNVRTDAPLAGRSAIAEVMAAVEGLSAQTMLALPGRAALTLVPPGHGGVDQLLVRLRVPDPALSLAFWTRVYGCELVDSRTCRWARTVLRFEPGPAAKPVSVGASLGWNYLTVQVRDCDGEHAAACAAGAREVFAPRTLRDVARFSVIADPDGTLLEVSERRSLTGRPLRANAAQPPPL